MREMWKSSSGVNIKLIRMKLYKKLYTLKITKITDEESKAPWKVQATSDLVLRKIILLTWSTNSYAYLNIMCLIKILILS